MKARTLCVSALALLVGCGGGAAGPSQRDVAPGAPLTVEALPGDGSALVTWSAPRDGASAITGYRVGAWDGAAVTTVEAAGTAARVTGLTAGHAYVFTVVAVSPVGPGAASAASPPVKVGGGITAKIGVFTDSRTEGLR